MQGIIHIRIDDRLIHGQVAAAWSTSLQASRIMVINDEVANNEFQKSILRMAVQGSINTSILTKKKAYENISNGKYASQRVMILLKNPKDALDLIEMGLDIKEINVGNMISDSETAIVVKQSLKLTPEQIEQFKELERKGVKLTARMTIQEPETYLKDYLNKLN